MRIISNFILLLIILLGLTFASLNAGTVNFNYYIASQEIALSVLLLIFFGAGIFFGMVAYLFSWFRLKSNNLQLKTQLKMAEIEIKNLRSIPIKG